MADNEKLGSTSPEVLLKNVVILDKLVSDKEKESLPDRFGALRRTWYGMEMIFSRFIDYITGRGEQAVASIGWQELGYWATGLTVDNRQQIVYYNGSWYKYLGELEHVIVGDSPENDGGVWSAENPTGKWSNIGDAALRSNLGSDEEGMGSALLMHHTGKSVAEYLDLYLATVFFITPEQYGAKGDTVQDDSDALEDAINKAVATSLMSGGVYTPVVVQLNKPYRITRTITIDASRVRLNAISGCGVYVDPDGTYTDNKVFNITGSGPNAAVAASKVGALFDGVLFLTNGEMITVRVSIT